LALYAIYSGGTLQKVVAINLDFFNSTTPRPTPQSVDVSEVLGQSLSIRRFTGASSDATGNVTWVGQSFDTGPGVGNLTVENYNDGKVSVGASEAVLIEKISKQ
jgi:hypothetical protein